MSNDKKIKELPEYGTPGYIYTLAWHDEVKRDHLIVTDALPEREVMNARAKGTTVYELIGIYGGIDEVSAAFSDKGEYIDVSAVPQFANDEEYIGIVANLQAQLDALKAIQKVEPEPEPELEPEPKGDL